MLPGKIIYKLKVFILAGLFHQYLLKYKMKMKNVQNEKSVEIASEIKVVHARPITGFRIN